MTDSPGARREDRGERARARAPPDAGDYPMRLKGFERQVSESTRGDARAHPTTDNRGDPGDGDRAALPAAWAGLSQSKNHIK